MHLPRQCGLKKKKRPLKNCHGLQVEKKSSLVAIFHQFRCHFVTLRDFGAGAE